MHKITVQVLHTVVPEEYTVMGWYLLSSLDRKSDDVLEVLLAGWQLGRVDVRPLEVSEPQFDRACCLEG